MQRARALRGIVRAAIPIAVLLAGAGCQSPASAPPGASTDTDTDTDIDTETGTAAAEPATDPGTTAEGGDAGAVNSTAKGSDTEPSLAMGGGVEEILTSTRRSAAGLPEPVPDYLSWFRLGRAPEGGGTNGAPATGAHYPACRAYILFPGRHMHSVGDQIPGNLQEGTLIVLEEKKPGGDFIARVRTMTRVPEGWKFSSYSRNSNVAPFSEEADTARCVTCHAGPPAGGGAEGVGESVPAGRGEAPGSAASGIHSRPVLE
ncbi:MAG TPA: hypothetical protein VMT52_06570 [Planctomycetota bacterium]|nr:hypothetical protein [Planctomycetota bacterium]